MGTRADFYVGRGPNAEWIGSRCYDGHPENIAPIVCRGLDVRKRLRRAIGALNNAARIRSSLASKTRRIVEQIEALSSIVSADVIEIEYRTDVRKMLDDLVRSDSGGVFPERGWPWPWPDSRTTDFAYALDGGTVWVSCFGSEWVDAADVPEDWPAARDKKTAKFPTMAAST